MRVRLASCCFGLTKKLPLPLSSFVFGLVSWLGTYSSTKLFPSLSWIDVVKNHSECKICNRDQTLDALISVVMVQMDGTVVPQSIPLCAAHHTQAETILRDSELLSGQSRSVVINLTAVSGNVRSGS